MAKKPIKTAVIALGRSGWNIHVNAQKNDDRFKVVSVMDLDEGRRKQAEEELGCDSYTDLQTLLKRAMQKSLSSPRLQFCMGQTPSPHSKLAATSSSKNRCPPL